MQEAMCVAGSALSTFRPTLHQQAVILKSVQCYGVPSLTTLEGRPLTPPLSGPSLILCRNESKEASESAR